MSNTPAVQCWNCASLVSCFPPVRPKCNCGNFKYYPYHEVAQTQIAEWLLVTDDHLKYMIKNYGTEKIIELLEIRGHSVRIERVTEYIKWYI